MKIRIVLAIGLLVVVLLGGWVFRLVTGPARPARPATSSAVAPVTVAMVTTKNMPVELRVFGRVEANATVSLNPKLPGF